MTRKKTPGPTPKEIDCIFRKSEAYQGTQSTSENSRLGGEVAPETISYFFKNRRDPHIVNIDALKKKGTIFTLAKEQTNYQEVALLFQKANQLVQQCLTSEEIAELIVIHYASIMKSATEQLSTKVNDDKEKALAFYKRICQYLGNSLRDSDAFFKNRDIQKILEKEPAILQQIQLAIAKNESDGYYQHQKTPSPGRRR